MTCTVFSKRTVWLSRCQSQLFSKWFLIRLFRLFILSSKKNDACLSLINGRVSGGLAINRGALKGRGFLKKKQEELINLYLQRCENIWKRCPISLSPSNELIYLKYMAENESLCNWWGWFSRSEVTMVWKTVCHLSFYSNSDFCATWQITGHR